MWSKDYVISVHKNCPIEDEAVLLMFASYKSDLNADSEIND